MLDTNSTLAHLACIIASERAASLQIAHNIEALESENAYLREVVGRLSSTPTPERGEVDPHRGRWARGGDQGPVEEEGPDGEPVHHHAYSSQPIYRDEEPNLVVSYGNGEVPEPVRDTS